MDTIKKGNKLEDTVYTLFTEEISENRFFVKKECCKIYKKKGYYSKDREKDIVFDVSIEITLPGYSTYSILILIECKNYNHKVPVDDIEEFFSKTQQISGCNIKGIVVSTNSFQEGAFNFSKSKGIGLLRYYDRDNLDWVLTRSPSSMAPLSGSMTDRSNAYQGLHCQDHKSRYFDCYGFFDNIYTNSLHRFVSCLVKTGLENNLAKTLAKIEKGYKANCRLVPYKEYNDIESLCGKVLKESGYKGGAVFLQKICRSLSKKYDLEVHRNSSLGPGVLGTISFDPLSIKIDDKKAETEQRIRFTMAHEIGHFLLGHEKYMKSEICQLSDIDLENPKFIDIKDVMRMEWQANYFASCLLLPIEQFGKSVLLEAVKNELIDRGYGLIYLDDQSCNIDTYYKVTSSLMNAFKVSRTVVKIRLKKLGFLNEEQKNPTRAFSGSHGPCAH